MSIPRRDFLKLSALTSMAVASPFLVPQSVFGANETILVGVVGLGGRGSSSHVPAFFTLPNVKVVALADPDKPRMAAVAKWMQEKNYSHKVDHYEDFRAMYDRDDVHAVGIATMNYWHGLNTIWACQAGKHVLCEKPLSHFIWEGRQMVNAARKYHRIVQHGTQLRSLGAVRDAVVWIRAGNLGKIKLVTAYANKPRTPIGNRKEPLPLPEGLNYDLWCGPAQDGPVYRDRLQYDCSFTWNMGDGESLNQGVHQIDVARWVLGDIEEMPQRVISLGGRFLFNDQGDVPNTQIIYYDYPDVPILYEVHNLRAAKNSNDVLKFRGFSQDGVVVDCEGGWVGIDHTNRCIAYDKDNKEIRSWNGGGNNFANFIDAVRAGNRDLLDADILKGQISTRIGHTGNISYRLGRKAVISVQTKAIEDYPPMVEMHKRYLDHLAAHGIDPSETILGEWLTCDTANECFVNNDEANRLVKGYYRSPYLVEEIA
ncbi:MAG: Gfo/Idh/MocA family oxidoreductase [Planctomycetaceae bacterium]|nr:Gfo/Idh/MocA family oxidoreductase [Planctomycetaceae bacterium]